MLAPGTQSAQTLTFSGALSGSLRRCRRTGRSSRRGDPASGHLRPSPCGRGTRTTPGCCGSSRLHRGRAPACHRRWRRSRSSRRRMPRRRWPLRWCRPRCRTRWRRTRRSARSRPRVALLDPERRLRRLLAPAARPSLPSGPSAPCGPLGERSRIEMAPSLIWPEAEISVVPGGECAGGDREHCGDRGDESDSLLQDRSFRFPRPSSERVGAACWPGFHAALAKTIGLPPGGATMTRSGRFSRRGSLRTACRRWDFVELS